MINLLLAGIYPLITIGTFGILYASRPEGIFALESYSAFFILITTSLTYLNSVLPLSSLFIVLFLYYVCILVKCLENPLLGKKCLCNKIFASFFTVSTVEHVLLLRDLIIFLNIVSFCLVLYCFYNWYRGVSIHPAVSISKFLSTSICFFLSTLFIWVVLILFFLDVLPVNILEINSLFFRN